MEEPAIEKEVQLEDIFTKEEIEQRKNFIRERAIRDYYSDMKTSHDEGVKEGIKEVIKKVTQKMGSKKMSISAIAELLDITEDEVKKYLEK